MTTKLAGTMAAALVAGAATAATVSNLTSSDDSRNAYSTNNKWSGGVAPANDSSKTYDFVVKNGYGLWIPENSNAMTFGGASLQMGDGTTKGSISYKGERRFLTFPDWRLYGGSFGQANNAWHGLAGNATVYSTAADPFVISTKGEFDTYFHVTLTGDETSAIRINAGKGNFPIYPSADQSGTYSGSWILGTNVYFRPLKEPSQKPSGAVCNNTTSRQVFGKQLSTLNPRALVLYPGANIRAEFSSGGATYDAADNRGIWLEAENDTVTYTMVNAHQHNMGWPIAGKGTLRLVNSGTFYLKAKCGVALKAASASTPVVLCDGAEITETGALEILNGGALTLNAVTDRITVNNPKLKDPTIVFAATENGTDAAQLRLAGNLDVTGKICLTLSAAPNLSADIPVLVIDKDEERVFASDDFVSQTPNVRQILVSRNGDGDQVVSLRVVPYVYSRKNVDWRRQLNNGTHWSDGKIPADSSMTYVIWDGTFVTGYADKTTVSVPGHWVLNASANYMCKEEKMTFEHLLMLNDSMIHTGQEATWTMTWAGDAVICTTLGHAAKFQNNGMRAAIVSANISGSGAIKGSCKGAGKDSPYYLRFTGDNSNYVGTFAVSSSNASKDSPGYFEIRSETSLGGNPSVFAPDAFRLGSFVQLNPLEGPITIDDANRGVTLETNSVVNADTGKDVTIKTPVVFEGAFTKVGTGTFAFGAGGATFGTGAAIAVNAGALKAEGVNALKGAAVSFADGAVLAFDAAVGAVDLTTTTLSKAGEKYLVRIDGLQEETAIATFASAQAAADFVANAKTVKGSAHKGSLFADGATVKAGVSGLIIIVR